MLTRKPQRRDPPTVCAKGDAKRHDVLCCVWFAVLRLSESVYKKNESKNGGVSSDENVELDEAVVMRWLMLHSHSRRRGCQDAEMSRLCEFR